MRKKSSIFLLILLLCIPIQVQGRDFKVKIDKVTTTVYDVNILLDETPMAADYKPYIHNSRTFVPIRSVAESFDSDVKWDQSTKSVIISKNGDSLTLSIDSNKATKNGQVMNLSQDSIPRLVRYPDGNDKTMVPLRVISEIMGYKVDWNHKTRTAAISSGKSSVQGKITSVKTTNVDQSKAYMVEGVNGCDFKSFTLTDPFRYVIDVENASFYNGTKTVTLDEPIGFGKRLRINEFSSPNNHPNTVRIVIDGESEGSAEIRKEGNDLIIIPTDKISNTQHTIQRENTNGNVDQPKKEDPVLTPRPTPSTRSDVKIVLDPGHGGKDPGAVNRTTGEREKDIIIPIHRKLESKLVNNGYTVISTNPNDQYISTWKRAEIANGEDAHMFLSIHANSAPNSSSTSGIETFYAPRDTVKTKYDPQFPFANSVHSELIKATGAINRGLKSGPRLIVVREARMPAALVEVGFVSSEEEVKLLTDDNYQNLIVDGLYSGITNYIKSEYGL